MSKLSVFKKNSPASAGLLFASKRGMHQIIIGFFLALGSTAFCADFHQLQKRFKEQMLHETSVGYHSDKPTAPVHIPGLSGKSTPEEIMFNRTILSHPQKCLFQGESSVEGEGWQDSSRVKVISTSEVKADKNTEHFLRACESIKKELGPGSCSVIEIAGHAEGFSVGLGEVFGFKVEQGKWKQFPQNEELFKKVVGCIQEISWKHAPVVFSSCGAGSVEDHFPIHNLKGKKLYYPSKHEAQQLMSNILERTVYSALGAENVQDWGKHCRDGWCKTEPLPYIGKNLEPASLQTLPLPRLIWNHEGERIPHD